MFDSAPLSHDLIAGARQPFVLDRVCFETGLSWQFGEFDRKVLVDLKFQTTDSNEGNSNVYSRAKAAA